MSTQTQIAKDEAIEALRTIFPRGSVVSTITLHVSKSGMLRSVAVLAPLNVSTVDGKASDPTEVANLSWQVARALGWKLHRTTDGVVVKGAGMDMHFHLIYTLAQTLYGDGYALSKRTI